MDMDCWLEAENITDELIKHGLVEKEVEKEVTAVIYQELIRIENTLLYNITGGI